MWPFTRKPASMPVDAKTFLAAMPCPMGQDGGMAATVEVMQPDGKLFQVRDGARVLFSCPVDQLAQIARLP